MNHCLHGKVALISSCSQGLGYEAAKILAAHGADIFGISIGDDEQLKKEIEAMGRSYHSMTADLSTPDIIHQVVKEVLAAYQHIDILLNFAHVLKKEDTLSLSRIAWKQALDINLTAAFFLSQEVIKQFLKQKQGGKIINASGILPLEADSYAAYVVGKGGMEAMTQYLASAFAKDNIQINAIRFGYMQEGSSLYENKEILKAIPARRLGTASDMEGALLLLASDQSNYMCGACIPVDGGCSIR